MATPTYGVLNNVLNVFRSQIDSGFGTLTGPVTGTLGILIVISVASMAVMWAVDETNHIWGHLIRKILLVGFWAFIITNWHSFSMSLISGMGKLGISAGGGGGGLASFLDNPSLVFKTGLDDAKKLLDYCHYLMGEENGWGKLVAPIDPISWIGFELQQMVSVIEVLIATVIVICAYGWLALEVVVTVIEFHIVTLVAFCVLPFGVLRQTTSLAENAVAYVFRAGFKAMVLGIIIALGSVHVLTKFTLVESPTTLPTLDMLAGLALGVLVILMLALHAPKYASAVIAGAPSNSAGGLIGAAGGVGAAAGLGARTAIAGVTGGLAGAIGAGRTLYNDLGGGSAGAARAASSLGGPGGGSPSPGVPRGPSPGGGGGSPSSRPPSGGSAFEGGGPSGSVGAAAADAAIGEVAAAEVISDAASPPAPPAPPSASASAAPADQPSPASSSGRSNLAWYATPVGLSSLSAPQLAAARRSYDIWTQANPGAASRYSFDAYVEYAQARHAESATDTDQQDEA